MPSPFPGMDPYIERPELWPDFHDSLIAAIKAVLQPLLRPRYAAMTQDRLYVVESERSVQPDVSIIESGRVAKRGNGAIAVLAPDRAVIFEGEEVRQPYIEIVEPATGNRVVTAIEVLRPTNKAAGLGRGFYVKKREELCGGGASVVEIDLLREGKHTVRLSERQIAGLDA